MPAYKDEERGTWYVKCYYTDYYGRKQQKKKRGFKTKREAKAWEDNFLANESRLPETIFKDVISQYLDDTKDKIAPSTLTYKKQVIEVYIMPVFGEIEICKITPEMVLSWQKDLMKTPCRKRKAQKLSPTTVNHITAQLSAIFNYAVKYYNVSKNPVSIIDRLKGESKTMDFWEVNQFKRALTWISNPEMHLIFQMLFFGGFRISELLALTPGDLQKNERAVFINKTYKLDDGKWIKGPPKSKNSTRLVALPDFLWDELESFVRRQYHLNQNMDIFTVSRSTIRARLEYIAEQTSLPRIRIHDLRHSHVSYLINLGFTIYEIADRIGDTPTVVERIYSHMYQSRRLEIADRIQRENSENNDISTKLVPQRLLRSKDYQYLPRKF